MLSPKEQEEQYKSQLDTVLAELEPEQRAVVMAAIHAASAEARGAEHTAPASALAQIEGLAKAVVAKAPRVSIQKAKLIICGVRPDLYKRARNEQLFGSSVEESPASKRPSGAAARGSSSKLVKTLADNSSRLEVLEAAQAREDLAKIAKRLREEDTSLTPQKALLVATDKHPELYRKARAR